MLRTFLAAVAFAGLLSCFAQTPGFPQPQGERVDGPIAIDRALQSSTLTTDGKPFHAVMDIGTAGQPYSGRVELWWLSATEYRMEP